MVDLFTLANGQLHSYYCLSQDKEASPPLLTAADDINPLGAVSPCTSQSSNHSIPLPEVSSLTHDPCLDDNANANPFFSNPVIRAFLFSNSDSILGDLSSVTTSKTSSHSHDPLYLVLDSPEPLLETAIDSPGALSPALPGAATASAPIACCDDDGDLSSLGVSGAIH